MSRLAVPATTILARGARSHCIFLALFLVLMMVVDVQAQNGALLGAFAWPAWTVDDVHLAWIATSGTAVALGFLW